MFDVPFRSQRGIALIITLIMLSVITFMAITFLYLSYFQRGSVNVATDQTTAQWAADTALERAKSELMARMILFTNDQVVNMMVSTNYINWLGLNGSFSPTNVNYDYVADGTPIPSLSGDGPLAALRTNVANLLYDPPPPVFVTNRVSGRMELCRHLDLNRNGRYDTNGWWPELAENGLPIIRNGVTNFLFFRGDPEWIGILARPGLSHSGDNYFLARYAYYVEPPGKGLDVNAIHNQAATRNLDFSFVNDGYVRNQGAGSWEINLPAFLADLNTNQWYADNGAGSTYYQYNRHSLPTANRGYAFEDALRILGWRYNNSYTNLAPADALFPFGAAALQGDHIDQYSDGPMMTGSRISETGPWVDPVNQPWVGANNPNRFFTAQELFNPARTSSVFTNRLQFPGTRTNSYDRYTFYRLLEQLGTESAPAEDKINVNYVNVDAAGNVVPGMETNLIPWAPAQFFTNAANRLLRLNTGLWWEENPVAFANNFGVTNGFGITNIPVLVSYTYTTNGQPATNNIFGYTAAVHRLLQQVANIYDSSGDANSANLIPLPPESGSKTLYAPHVLRPLFRRNPGQVVTNVYIAGYREVTSVDSILPRLLGTNANFLMVDLQNPADRVRVLASGVDFLSDSAEPMISGIPLIVGAKKGFPNFNKFALQNEIKVTRQLSFQRPVAGARVNHTNQIYSLQISNCFGVQAWNSYNNAFTRHLEMIAVGDVTLSLTNEIATGAEYRISLSHPQLVSSTTLIDAGTWPRFASPQSSISFVMPLFTNTLVLTNMEYAQRSAARGGGGVFKSPGSGFDLDHFRVPRWWLNTRSRLRFILIDRTTRRIVDYVNLDSSEKSLNIIQAAIGNYTGDKDISNLNSPTPDAATLWLTNRLDLSNNETVPTYGVQNQILISMGLPQVVSESYWKQYNAQTRNKEEGIEEFRNNYFATNGGEQSLVFTAPFSPTRSIYQYIRWEANDPLVHQTPSDLTDLLMDYLEVEYNAEKSPVRRLIAETPLNNHYRPWGGNPNNDDPTSLTTDSSPKTKFNTGVKDPLVSKSDDWDFPTEKLPNIGWLGRVHRGSPWQTVYLKSREADFDAKQSRTWQKWSGITNANGYDVTWGKPTSDRLLFDLFTAAPNANATHGQLSVNQTNLAAWSAVLSGVLVLNNQNNHPANAQPVVIQPAGIYTPTQRSPVAQIVSGINDTRTNANPRSGPVFPNQTFAHVGDVLATPQLTDRSPYLSTNGVFSDPAAGINDQILERIPQQIMGLLTLNRTPRFVVYSYGQTLRPAERSLILTPGPFYNLCTNYQVTAEVATRAVMRVEGTPDRRYANAPDPYGRFYPPRIVLEQFNVLPPD
jgi:hypothetical protein